MTDFSKLITEAEPEGYNPEDDYPPIEEPNEALGLSLDGDCNYWILAHTGRYLHGQIECAGMNGEESGISFPDEIGYFVLENGKGWNSRDWETGIVDDYGLDGDTRPALYADFVKFKADIPPMLADMQRDLQRLYDQMHVIEHARNEEALTEIAAKYGLTKWFNDDREPLDPSNS